MGGLSMAVGQSLTLSHYNVLPSDEDASSGRSPNATRLSHHLRTAQRKPASIAGHVARFDLRPPTLPNSEFRFRSAERRVFALTRHKDCNLSWLPHSRARLGCTR